MDTHKGLATGAADADRAAVARLLAAHEEASGTLDTLPDIEDAYAVQAAVLAALAAASGAHPAGYKLSFTLAEPPASGLAAAPAYGRLLSDQLVPSGSALPLVGDPLVECEVMVRARVDLADGASTDELVAGLEACAVVEVPVSRFAGWWPEGGAPRLTVAEFVADACLAAYVVTGTRWVPLEEVDLVEVTVELTTPDGTSVAGTARAVMGHPLNAVRWLLARIGTLPAGEVVSTGTMTPALRPGPGPHVARFSAPFGEVRTVFADPGWASEGTLTHDVREADPEGGALAWPTPPKRSRPAATRDR